MKLVQAVRPDDLQAEIKRRFADFNKISSRSRGRRYPEDLKELALSAVAQGLEVATLCRLTGLPIAAARRWLAAATSTDAAAAKVTAAAKRVAARRLSVVDASPTLAALIVVRLPSGVTIELTDGRALSADLLAALGTMEVHRATSR